MHEISKTHKTTRLENFKVAFLANHFATDHSSLEFYYLSH